MCSRSTKRIFENKKTKKIKGKNVSRDRDDTRFSY